MARLIHFSLDPFSRRIRLALAEYGAACDFAEEMPWAPGAALLSANPMGTVPVFLEDDGAAVSGIEAISEYIEETRGRSAPLIPGPPLARAEVRRLTGWFDTKFYAEVSEPVISEKIVRRFLPREAGGGPPDMGRVRAALGRLRGHLDYLGSLSESRWWLAGDAMSLADLAAAAHLSAVDFTGDIQWTEYPAAKAWYQRIKSRPSFRPLLADTVRGMVPPVHYADLDF